MSIGPGRGAVVLLWILSILSWTAHGTRPQRCYHDFTDTDPRCYDPKVVHPFRLDLDDVFLPEEEDRDDHHPSQPELTPYHTIRLSPFLTTIVRRNAEDLDLDYQACQSTLLETITRIELLMDRTEEAASFLTRAAVSLITTPELTTAHREFLHSDPIKLKTELEPNSCEILEPETRFQDGIYIIALGTRRRPPLEQPSPDQGGRERGRVDGEEEKAGAGEEIDANDVDSVRIFLFLFLFLFFFVCADHSFHRAGSIQSLFVLVFHLYSSVLQLLRSHLLIAFAHGGPEGEVLLLSTCHPQSSMELHRFRKTEFRAILEFLMKGGRSLDFWRTKKRSQQDRTVEEEWEHWDSKLRRRQERRSAQKSAPGEAGVEEENEIPSRERSEGHPWAPPLSTIRNLLYGDGLPKRFRRSLGNGLAHAVCLGEIEHQVFEEGESVDLYLSVFDTCAPQIYHCWAHGLYTAPGEGGEAERGEE